MSNDRELIKKLFKIAESQQKIITKLAQAQGLMPDAPVATGGGVSSGFTDLTKTVQGLLALIPEAAGVTAVDCKAGPSDGVVYGKLQMPKGAMSARVVIQKLQDLLVGKTVKDDSGKDVTITADKMKIQLTGLLG